MSDDSKKSVYEMRRQSRGTEPPEQQSPWKRRLLIGGAALGLLVLLGAAYFLHFSLTHVTLRRAMLWTQVHELSTDVDARLEKLLVGENEKVSDGQVLARLDDSEQRARLAVAEAELNVVRAEAEGNVATAQEGVREAEARLAKARAALQLARERGDAELKRAEARLKETEARLERLRKGPREESVQAARARLATARALQQLYRLEVEQSQKLVAEGIDSEYILEAKKTQLETQKNRVREAELEVKQMQEGPTEEEVRAQEQALLAREAELALARAATQQVKELAAEVALREAELRRAEAELQEARAGQVRVKLAERKVDAAREALEHMTIKSPAAGRIVRIFPEEGEICRKGEPAIRVRNAARPLWVQGYVDEEDAMRVEPGQPAEVEIMSGLGIEVKGRVSYVGPEVGHSGGGSTSPGTGGAAAGAGSVFVKIELMDQNSEWRPGSSAQAVVETR